MATFWDPLRAGWGVVWHLTVEGIPVVWCERVLSGLTLPSGYTADASLVIDRSAEVGSLADRNTGIGAGLPLTARLRDTTASRQWARAPSVETSLTTSLTATDVTVAADDTSGLAASGDVWIGTEAISYTGNTGTSLTGCTRGKYGSRKLPHSAEAIVASVGDRPRQWRGRLVTLQAVLVTPSGILDTSGTLAALGKVVWRGWVATDPRRVNGGFEFEAMALDRVLDRALSTAQTATVTATGTLFAVNPSFTFSVAASMKNAAGVVIHSYKIVVAPFDGMTWATMITTAEAHARIHSAWAAALPATTDTTGGAITADTHFSDTLEFWKMPNDEKYFSGEMSSPGKPKGKWITAGHWSIYGRYKGDAAVVAIDLLVEVAGEVTVDLMGNGPSSINYTPNLKTDDIVMFNWFHLGDPQGLDMTTGSGPGVVVRLDDALAVPPAPGLVKVDKAVFPYTAATQNGDQWALTGANVPTSQIGQKVDLVSTTTGTYADLMRAVIGSCDGSSVAVLDILGAGNGYGIPDECVDLDSFDAQAMGALVYHQASLQGQGNSAAALFGGALALSQRCLVLREEGHHVDSPCRLGLVSCDPGGSGWTDAISDNDLLSVGTDPISVVDLRDQPTGVRVVFRPSPTQTEGLTVTVQDGPEMAIGGGAVAELSLLGTADKPDDAVTAVTGWASSLLRTRRTVQAIDIMLPPWRDVRIGATLAIDLTHPDLWDPLTGLARISGIARCIGLARHLTTCAVKATLLVASSDSVELCPSFRVQAYTGPAGAPLTITVGVAAAAVLAENLTATGAASLVLQHTIPGMANEGGGGVLTVTVNTATGVLTVTSSAGLVDALTAQSYLTWVESGTCDAYQLTYAHEAQGQVWS